MMALKGFTNAEEDLAVRFVRLAGFTVLNRNTRRFGAELDILATNYARNEYIIFEVKRWHSEDYPALSVHQRRRLEDAARAMQASAGKFLSVSLCLLVVDCKSESVIVTPIF